ncbi:sunset domain-containing protein [Clostridium tyrobutyricum]|uniref:sunset domain-containing protein n=1 Tax=Clostridium tyrobutyricum TaxID=1519 RepID=UPI0020CCB86C|nr:thermonuclease family protein [Clostridium tyrobutyricum]
MKEILKCIPGFRSGKKPKMIAAIIYYIFCLLMLTVGWGVFLLFLALPFIIFYAVNAIKNKSKRSIITCLLAVAVMCVGIVNAPKTDTSSKQTNVASNTQKETSVPAKNVSKSSKTSTEIKSPIKLEKAKVTHHTDGDTIGVILENGKYEKVRFIGVNTPESTTKHEQYGEQASSYTKSQLFGKTVYLESDAGSTDKYGRLLRYVWLSPPTAINETEIKAKMFNAILAYNGYAEQMTIQPNVKYADYFKKFCAESRQNNRGLWAINPNGTTKGDGISAPSSSTSSAKNSNNNSSSSNTNAPSSTSSSSSSQKSSSSSSSGSSTSGSASNSSSWYTPSSSTQSSTSTQSSSSGQGKIKGNINSKGEKIYHVPGGAYYDRTDAEEYFDTEAQAQAAGYRPSKR